MRSGTTLLVNILSSHPQLFKMGYELRKAWEDLAQAPMTTTCPSLNESNADPWFTYQMTRHFDQYICEGKSIMASAKRLRYLSKTGTGRVWFDWKNIIPLTKSTHLINKLPFINTVFPNSKKIIIIRNIYAQSASLKVHLEKALTEKRLSYQMPNHSKSCWDVRKLTKKELASSEIDIETIASMWFRLNQLGLEHSQRDQNTLMIHYEDLVTKQPEVMENVFNFLGLNPKYRSVEKKIAERKYFYKNTTTKGESLSKWKSTLTETEIESIDNITQKNRLSKNFPSELLDKPTY